MSESLRDIAELAVSACLNVLPLQGSDTAGYYVPAQVHSTVVALPSEWATAAHCIAALHAALKRTEAEAGGS